MMKSDSVYGKQPNASKSAQDWMQNKMKHAGAEKGLHHKPVSDSPRRCTESGDFYNYSIPLVHSIQI